MHIVDISALYSPSGGGIRTYTLRKLAVADSLGQRLTVIVPGAEAATEAFGAARLITLPSPRFPLDRNYFYFESDDVIQDALTREAPDFIEASSPWGSATAVAEWPGPAPRALVMHADPLSAHAYRWLDSVVSRRTIDRGFDWFWRHLKRLDAAHAVVHALGDVLLPALQLGHFARQLFVAAGLARDIAAQRLDLVVQLEQAAP